MNELDAYKDRLRAVTSLDAFRDTVMAIEQELKERNDMARVPCPPDCSEERPHLHFEDTGAERLPAGTTIQCTEDCIEAHTYSEGCQMRGMTDAIREHQRPEDLSDLAQATATEVTHPSEITPVPCPGPEQCAASDVPHDHVQIGGRDWVTVGGSMPQVIRPEAESGDEGWREGQIRDAIYRAICGREEWFVDHDQHKAQTDQVIKHLKQLGALADPEMAGGVVTNEAMPEHYFDHTTVVDDNTTAYWCRCGRPWYVFPQLCELQIGEQKEAAHKKLLQEEQEEAQTIGEAIDKFFKMDDTIYRHDGAGIRHWYWTSERGIYHMLWHYLGNGSLALEFRAPEGQENRVQTVMTVNRPTLHDVDALLQVVYALS